MSLDTRIRWLKFAAAITFGFGLLHAMAAIPAFISPVQVLLDLAYFPVDGGQAIDYPAARLLNAITGGLMTGLGVMTFLIAGELLPREPALARRILLAGIGAWFLVDSSMSIAAGAPLNAAFNTGFLLLFYVPLWKPFDTAPGLTTA